MKNVPLGDQEAADKMIDLLNAELQPAYEWCGKWLPARFHSFPRSCWKGGRQFFLAKFLWCVIGIVPASTTVRCLNSTSSEGSDALMSLRDFYPRLTLVSRNGQAASSPPKVAGKKAKKKG